MRAKNDTLYAEERNYSQRIQHDGYLQRCLDDAAWIMKRIRYKGCGQPRKHLDIGCSSGGMMAAFTRFGLESYGIEPSIAVDCAPTELASRIQKCYFGEETFNERFDIITAFHVLEHVIDPEAFVRMCRDKLNAHGIIVIEVPVFAFARNRIRHLPHDLLNHISPYYHVHHFTARGLHELLTRVGFTIKRSDRVAPRVRIRRSANSASGANASVTPSTLPASRIRSKLLLRASIKNAFWSYRPVRMWGRHLLADTLGFGQFLRVIAVLA